MLESDAFLHHTIGTIYEIIIIVLKSNYKPTTTHNLAALPTTKIQIYGIKRTLIQKSEHFKNIFTEYTY